MLARSVRELALVSIEPEKLVRLERQIRGDAPRVDVVSATTTGGLLGRCDLVISATSAFGQRILDITECKPGAVICDVARPPDISPSEVRLRPDVLVIESGEVLIPGEVDFHYDIGLPPRVAYACLAETALLAMEGRFESFTLGRMIDVSRVNEIHRLFDRHGFRLARLRSLGRDMVDSDIAGKRALAETLMNDPDLLDHTRRRAARRLLSIPLHRESPAPPSQSVR
jgi:predicted amino acid dehydrogenase